MTRLKYDYAMLKNICDEGNVTLLSDYSDKYITRDTRIIGKCILCENSFDKCLNVLYKHRNFGCEPCVIKIRGDRVKNTMVTKYGVEYASQSLIFRDKMKSTCLKKYGVEYATQSNVVKEKTKQTNLETYGVEYGLQNAEVKEKGRLTNLENYGFENPLQREEIKEKIKQTCLIKYGVEHSIRSESSQLKTKETNFEKYGFEYGFQNEEIKEKIRLTNLENYGFEYATQSEEIKEKTKQTCLIKYGVEYVTQCPEIMEKNVKSSYSFKDYLMPSGNIKQIQGYEHYALDELIKDNINENDIITGCVNVPIIWYDDENDKKHRHFVDIFIPSQNKCIEVKSTWTFELHHDIVLLKQLAAQTLGYLYEIWVYDNKGKKIIL